MNAPLWVVELAAEFWREAGGPEPFPRRLRTAIARSSFDLTVEELPDLTVAGVERHLARRGRSRSCDAVDRALRGCLVAENGGGFIFLDARDDVAERTYSLAHELGHFLRDYWQLRRRAVAALGPAVLDVLDGRRPASIDERLHALLRDAPIGCHVHLMRREKGALLVDVDAAEEEADQLALELLAPAAEVIVQLATTPAQGVARPGRCPGLSHAAPLGLKTAPPGTSSNGAQGESPGYRPGRAMGDGAGCEALLRQAFGLPETVAGEYAEMLFPVSESSPFLERLKKALAARRTSPAARELESGGSRDEQQR